MKLKFTQVPFCSHNFALESNQFRNNKPPSFDLMFARNLVLLLAYVASYATGHVFPSGPHRLGLSLGVLTIASVAGLCGSGTACGRFLFVFSTSVVRRIDNDTCDEKCVFYPLFVIFSFFGLESRRWECGSCNDVTNIVALDGANSDFEIISCDTNALTVAGDLVANLQVGNRVLYVDGSGDPCNFNCNGIFRKIVSIQDGTINPATKELSTELLTINDVFGSNSFDQTTAETPIETLWDCQSRQAQVPAVTVYEGMVDKRPEGMEDDRNRRQLLGECAPNWLKKNGDGRCSLTNCFVGETGNADDCFICKTTCDNGCGAADSIFNFDGDFFGFYDFGPACCNHDYCWSSTNSRDSCDRAFLANMLAACPSPGDNTFVLIDPFPRLCRNDAYLFYSLVSSFIGTSAHSSAQDEQQAYEELDVCTAKCPTTQNSGGQGTTTLTIDLLRSSGVFPVTYEMYSIPDELTILYEGSTIFGTGGLVSGSSSVSVSFSGTSTKIQVIINAPLSGTAWDVFVGCPTAP